MYGSSSTIDSMSRFSVPELILRRNKLIQSSKHANIVILFTYSLQVITKIIIYQLTVGNSNFFVVVFDVKNRYLILPSINVAGLYEQKMCCEYGIGNPSIYKGKIP